MAEQPDTYLCLKLHLQMACFLLAKLLLFLLMLKLLRQGKALRKCLHYSPPFYFSIYFGTRVAYDQDLCRSEIEQSPQSGSRLIPSGILP